MNKKNFLIGLLTILMVGSSTLSFASDQTIVSDTIPSLEKKVQTNYDLAKAKTALLKSQIALKIDKNRQNIHSGQADHRSGVC